MLKPKSRPSGRYWEALSDELLLDVDLVTDNPQSLSNLVTVLPEGDQEPHVEYKYDLRGTHSDKLRCVHCHQPHLAGYVMLKEGLRFFVGHICGAHIYGADFEKITADYNGAVNRQQALRRRREIEERSSRSWRCCKSSHAPKSSIATTAYAIKSKTRCNGFTTKCTARHFWTSA